MRAAPMIALNLAALLSMERGRAQSVRWEPAESDPPNAVTLVFEECKPDGQPVLPTIPGVTLTPAGHSERTTFLNSQMTRSVMHNYVIRSRPHTPVEIPAFTVKTDKGVLNVAAYAVDRSGKPLESGATAKLIPDRTSVWAGEVFNLNYELSVARRVNPQIAPTFDWPAAPLIPEQWSKPEVTEAVVNGERRLAVVFKTRAFAKAPATLKLESAQHLLSIQTGSLGFGVVSQPRREQVSVTSNQPSIEVRALPEAPAGFSGAVGQFTFTSKVTLEKVVVGEPITWTLQLTGTGNWPEIGGFPEREASADFEVVAPLPKRTDERGRMFDQIMTQDTILVPATAGEYTLGGVSFTYFDPQTGSYRTITAEPITLTITPSAKMPAAPARPRTPGTRKFGGSPIKSVSTGPADPAHALAELQLEQVRRRDSPARLFEMMKTAGPTQATAPGKN